MKPSQLPSLQAWTFASFLLLAFAAPAALWARPALAATGGKVIGYYDLSGGTDGLSRVPWASLTTLNIAFIGIDPSGRCSWMQLSGHGGGETKANYPDLVRAIKAARDANNPSVKLVLSVGGWTLSHAMSEAASSTDRLVTMAESCAEVVNALSLDGLDVDWEYPTNLGLKNCPANRTCERDSDPDNFVALLAMARAVLHQDKILSVAVYLDPTKQGIPYNVALMDPFLDSFNIMAYDVAAPNWHPGTALQAGVSDSEAALEAYAAAGGTKSKLVLGVPFYGYVWQHAQAARLGSSAAGKQSGAQVSTPQLLATYASDPGCTLTSTGDADVYYCTSGAHAGDWTAVDTVRILAAKANYVRDHGFGGLMAWEIQSDPDGSLTATLAREQH